MRRPSWMPGNALWLALAIYPGACLAVAPLMQVFQPDDLGAAFVFACMGLIAASAGLVGIFTVLGPFSFLRRMLMGLVGAATLFASWLGGYGIAASFRGYTPFRLDSVIVPILCAPLFLIAIQLPLWGMRMWLRWTVVEEGRETASRGSNAASLRDLFLATGAVAASLTLTRLSFPYMGPGVSNETDFWFGTGIAVTITFAVSIAATIPVLYATLRATHLPYGLMAIGSYSAAIVTALFVTLLIIDPPAAGQARHLIPIVVTINAFFAGLVLPLVVIRHWGYRLRWGNETGAFVDDASGESPFEAAPHVVEERLPAASNIAPDIVGETCRADEVPSSAE